MYKVSENSPRKIESVNIVILRKDEQSSYVKVCFAFPQMNTLFFEFLSIAFAIGSILMITMNESVVYELSVQSFKKGLGNLIKILEKAETQSVSKKIAFEILLNSRLFPDQFHLTRQIQIACDTAKLCASRISGKEAPVHADSETNLEELKVRILSVIQYLDTFKEQDFKQVSEIKVSQPRWEGKYLTGLEYLIQHAIPNFYFHITTSYAILRHNGIEIGKKDYLGEMPFKI